ncbi:nucleoside/nucleotide kinase family protein [Saccharopolyspora flava]|uniref:Panthothenate kinase n=1 Tax=Saccharopolyspora flava TaxID=95161 RepID=A0A1I6P7W9_9PSEU|nr:nucleoside/nucleotide kinase family protein [Saccharopolyspora flava]SFS36287.1 Panthothenate kinase [Saccharopolyspora flava]
MYSELISRAERLAGDGRRRRILGIAGAPGAGKGTVAERVLDALGDRAVLVPMDGFHLANAQLRRLGRADRKGAPDTFDAAGYVALLRRIREGSETVFAPSFHREIEESFAAEIAVDPDVPLIITEGNYLLLDTPPWAPVRGLLDECWFLAPDDDERVQRLIDRHVRYGRTLAEATEWVHRSDERNAAVVAATRDRADLIVEGDPS